MKVKDLMQTSVITLRSSDALDIAEDLMHMGRIRHLPVVDASNRLLGLVTQRDLFKAAMSSIVKISHEEERQWLGKVLVRDVMTKAVTTVDPEADLLDAADKLLTGKFGCLPVVENRRLVGILTETDFLQYVQTLLAKNQRSQPAAKEAKKATPRATW
jgi:CBS domain-containing protein